MRRRIRPATVVLGLALVFLYAPIAMLIVNSVNSNRSLTHWGGFTTQWYKNAVSDSEVGGPFTTSVIIAVIATVLSLCLAITACLWWRGASPRMRVLFNGVNFTRIMLPEVATAVGMFLFFKKTGLALGTTAVIIGHVVFTSAYATIIIQARLGTMDSTLEEAAADLGARPSRAFRRVTLPLLMPAIIVAGLLSLIFSFDDVITSQFLAGTDTVTLPLLLFGLIRFQVTPEVNAIGSGVMLLTSLTFMMAVLASRAGSSRISHMVGFGESSKDDAPSDATRTSRRRMPMRRRR